MKNEKRPVNLNLLTIRLPIPALASILHRVSGVLLFLAIPTFLYGFQQALISPESFAALQKLIANPLIKTWVWLVISAFVYHLIAGTRHILMDFGIGEGKASGKTTAVIVLVLAIACSIIIGVRLW